MRKPQLFCNEKNAKNFRRTGYVRLSCWFKTQGYFIAIAAGLSRKNSEIFGKKFLFFSALGVPKVGEMLDTVGTEDDHW